MNFFGWLPLTVAFLHLDSSSASKAPNGSYLAKARHLYDHLMKDYRTSIRPVNDSRETVAVEFSLSLISVEDLDEENHIFRVNGILIQIWKDFRLTWSPEDLDKVDFLDVAINDIWNPDIAVINNKDAYFFPPNPRKAYVTSNGLVNWAPPINIETHCELDLSDFPFDEHVCKVVFASWSQSDLAINLTLTGLDSNPGDVWHNVIDVSINWDLTNITIERNERRSSCCNDPYPEFTYKFTIRRRSTFTTHLFIGPSAMLCLVTPVVFLLPPGSGEKMIFGIGVLIADTLLLGELINYIPMAHPNLPLIAKYFVGNIVMVSLSLVISAIIIGFWDKSASRLSGPPAFFRLIFLGPVATILCVKKDDLFQREERPSGGDLQMNPEGGDGTESTSGANPGADKKRLFTANSLRNATKSEWRQLAIVFDRLFFVIYCVIVAIFTMSFARYL